MEFLLAASLYLPQWDLSLWTTLKWTGVLLGVIHIPSVLLERGTRPMAALVWIFCLITLPYVGIVLWWGMGRNYLRRPKRRRSRSREQMARSFANLVRQIDVPKRSWIEPQDNQALDTLRAKALYLRDEFGAFPTTQNNQVDVYHNASHAYDAFESQMRLAKHHIHVQFYIWRRDETGTRFRDILLEKAREGVEVRVLYDAVGASTIEQRNFMQRLREAGGLVAPFLPVRLLERRLRVNFRNHRKIIVIDGICAFTGGINIGNEYLDWMDLAFRFEGPVVYQLQEVFAEDWYFATREDLALKQYFHPYPLHAIEQGEATLSPDDSALIQGHGARHGAVARIVASGPDDPINTIHKMFFLAITTARERIYIITPYFVPDQAIITALQSAAMRGVDVRLLVPQESDIPVTRFASRGYYEELLESGVRIFEYTKRILHAKLLIFDRTWSFVGSANMDIRSFRFNFEANCVLDSRSLNKHLTRLFLDSQEDSVEVTLEQFRKRSERDRLIEGAARLLSPML